MDNAEQLINLIHERGARVLECVTTDLTGRWQVASLAAENLTSDAIKSGLALPGDGGRFLPDASAAVMDPFREFSTLLLPGTREADLALAPRAVAQRADTLLNNRGVAEAPAFQLTVQCYLFDDARFELSAQGSQVRLDSIEGAWNRAREEHPNLAHKRGPLLAGAEAAPVDHYQDLRSEILLAAREAGIDARAHRHGAGPGQAEFELHTQGLTRSADQVLLFKYLVRNTALKYGKTATFMRHPLASAPASILTIDIKPGSMPAAGDRLVRHACALMAFAAPTANSYRGGLTPRSTDSIQIAEHGTLRLVAADACANPYLLFPALLLAATEGPASKPGDSAQTEIPAHPAQARGCLPNSLLESLAALETDSAFLTRDNVFSPALLRAWLDLKRGPEIALIERHPHPAEFELYYDL